MTARSRWRPPTPAPPRRRSTGSAASSPSPKSARSIPARSSRPSISEPLSIFSDRATGLSISANWRRTGWPRSATASRSRCWALTSAARSSSACARSISRPARIWAPGGPSRRGPRKRRNSRPRRAASSPRRRVPGAMATGAVPLIAAPGVGGGVDLGAVDLGLPSVIGHRGAAGLAPENTLAALRKAHAVGCRWVEIDLRLTADGALVLLHDERIDRTTNGRGRVARFPWAALQRYDAGGWFDPAFAGEPVPSLAEAIAVLGECGLGANVELKCARDRGRAIGGRAAAELTRLWPPQLPAPLLSSFVPDALDAARAAAPGIARALLLGRATPGRWGCAADLGCIAIGLDHRSLRRSVVAEIREAGYCVLAYTVNDAARARELFDWGVTSVFSDVPHLIIGTVAAGDGPDGVAPPAGRAASRRDIVS